MPYSHGYPQIQYGGYPGYVQDGQTYTFQANQTQYTPQPRQQPMVVIPQQPRPAEYQQFQASPQVYQSQFQQQPGFQQQYAPQYSAQASSSPQFYSQPQQVYQQAVSQQPVQVQNQPVYQQPYQAPPPQASFHSHGGQRIPHSGSPQTHYNHLQRQSTQNSTQQSHHRPLPVAEFHGQQRVEREQPRQQQQQQLPHPRTQTQNRAAQEANHQQSRLSSSPDPLQETMRPTPRQVVARVEIPVKRHDPNLAQADMARPQKRRRSNEGRAVPVCDGPAPQKRSSQQIPKQALVASSPLTELASSQLPPPPTPLPNVDYQAILLELSDQYTAAAYGMTSSLVVSDASDELREEYYSLLSTAMGCLESVLNNYRQSDPRKEARIRLRLATLLIEETENDQEAEEVLSKGMALCERSRLPDLKYAMHHVLVRVIFKRNSKAALKTVDKLVQECEALELTHWIYTFRFLRVSLSLQIDGPRDTAAILKHLTSISAIADDHRHVTVQIVAAVLEALVHVQSGSSEAVELAQRAMATARTHQLGSEMQQIPQARALLDSLDLACCLIQWSPDQITAKMQQMQGHLDKDTRTSPWGKDGAVHVELGLSAGPNLEQDTCGIMRTREDTQVILVLRWITKSQLYALGFLLSGLATVYKSSVDTTAEKFLTEGIKLLKQPPESTTQSLASAEAKMKRHAFLGINMRMHLIFAFCTRYEWQAARKAIAEIRNEYAQSGIEVNSSIQRLLLYSEATCRQGLGDLQGALQLYTSTEMTFEPDNKAPHLEKELRALATLNSVFILRSLGPEGFARAEHLVSVVESFCLQQPNKALAAVYYIVKATASSSANAIVKTKQYVQHAVQAAKAISNQQLLVLVMNIMTSTFFTNIVGDQAEKSSKAGRTLAKKNQDKLWTTVACGMYGDLMERNGSLAEAEMARKEAQSLIPGLPDSLKNQLRLNPQ